MTTLPNRIVCSVPTLMVAVLLLALLSVKALGQQTAARPDRGAMPGASYSVSDIESVSLTNGNLHASIPLASLPPIAGGKLSLTVSAIYDSKQWNVTREEHQSLIQQGCQNWVVSTPQVSDVGGWRLSGGYRIVFRDATEDFNYVVPDDPNNPSGSCEHDVAEYNRLLYSWKRVVLISPDGAEHELRPTDNYQPYAGSRPYLFNYYKDTPDSINTPMRYYSFDGSFMYAVINPSSYATHWTVYLNDGTRVSEASNSIQRITDTRGNSIKIFSDLDGSNNPVSHFQDEQTGREIKYTDDPTGNNGTRQVRVQYKTVGGDWETVYVNWGITNVKGKLYRVDDWTPFGGEDGMGFYCYHDVELGSDTSPVGLEVIREIIFPVTEPNVAARQFSFAYNSDTTESATDDAKWACSMSPQSFARTASVGMGDLSQIVTPSGATVNYTYSRDHQHSFTLGSDTDAIPRETVTQKQITHDGIAETWTYNIAELSGTGGSVTGPDGSATTETSYNHDPSRAIYFGPNLGLGGLVFRSSRSNKELIERHWTTLPFSGSNIGTTGMNNNETVPFNPVVDAEYFSLLDDTTNHNPIKMSAKTYQYDYNGNLLAETDYDWFDPSLVSRGTDGVPLGVPAGATALRTISNSIYNGAGTDPASNNVYAKRSLSTAAPLILSAPQQMTVGSAITQLSYDGNSYGVAPTVGNLTAKSVWDDLDSKWITTSQTYGLYGNVATATDARGKLTQFFYDDATHALPNRVVVDPENGTGTQTTTTYFDFSTGLVTSTTDPNNQMSTIDYTNQLLGSVDPFGRPGFTKSPAVIVNGTTQQHRVTNYYEDHLRRATVAADLYAENDQLLKTRTTSDMLGRPILSEQTEDGTNYTIYSRKAYDTANRVTYSSGPMRYGVAASTDSWTRVTSDVLGRPTEVATFGGASQPAVSGTGGVWTGSVATSYYVNTVTVTDQAGKQRESVSDALGRLTSVFEDPNGLNYQTSYDYDLLGNLRHVYQGSQTRTFTYDSLSRLRTAQNPESNTVSYSYDDNGNLTGKTDARSITTNYAYDSLNRVTSRNYTNDPNNTPAVSYTYDSASISNGKGRLASVSSSVSSYSYSSYDATGKVLSASQLIGSQTYAMSYGYDLSGHVKTITYPSGRTVNYGYDNAGRTTGFSGNLGDGGTSRTYSSGISYSALGGMNQEQLGTTIPIYNKLFYNSRGQLSEIREGLTANDTSWQRGSIVNFYSTCWGMCWNPATQTGDSMPSNNGNLKIQQVTIPRDDNAGYENRSDQFTQYFEYDSLNRLQFANEASWRQWYSYDRYGNRTISTDPNLTYGTGIPKPDFTVNTGNNRLGVPSGQTGTMHYDSAGNLDIDTYSAAAVSRLYDAENRMTKETQANSYDAGIYSYDGDGRRVKRVVGGVETWQVYGVGGELIAEYAQNGSPASPQKEYGYRNGQLLITATVSSGGWGTPPAFDDNPLNPHFSGETTVRAAHITQLRTAINALRSHMSQSAYSWQYSATTNDYISANPILEMRTALDQALGTPSGGYAAGLASGQPIKAIHIQELRDRILAAWQNGSGGVDLRWTVSDQLGTPRMILDASGSLANVSRHDYLPFGEELTAGTGGRTTAQGYVGDNTRQKFSQKERDNETNLDYFLARYYSSTQGRFTSPDEFRGGPRELYVLGSGDEEKQALPYAEITNPQSLNKYTYCYNNPLQFVDPDGHQGLIDSLQRYAQALIKRYHDLLDPQGAAEEQRPRSPGNPDWGAVVEGHAQAMGQAAEIAWNVASVADITGVGSVFHGTVTHNRGEVALGMVALPLSEIFSTGKGAVTSGELIAGRVGKAEVLAQFSKEGDTLVAGIAALFNNAKGLARESASQQLFKSISAFAKEQGLSKVEVQAIAVVNPSLERKLVKEGFQKTTVRVLGQDVPAYTKTFNVK